MKEDIWADTQPWGLEEPTKSPLLNAKVMRFPIDVILVCIRWYATYPLSYRHVEEMMEERALKLTIHLSTIGR